MTQDRALSILKTGANVFLTGEPGAGKSHTINEYVSYLREHAIEPAITASTGIAATHISGMTIHSWSGIGIKKNLNQYEIDRIASLEYISRRITKAKVLIIDEISMLPPEALNDVDKVCREVRKNESPFGGLQVVFVGDFFQLPPISKKEVEQKARAQTSLHEEDYSQDPSDVDTREMPAVFAYQSEAWLHAKPLICYLSEQHRQDDREFLSLLAAIRSNSFEEGHLEYLESRRTDRDKLPENVTKLFSKNFDVDTVNSKTLSHITEEERTYTMSHTGREALVIALKKGCLSPEVLKLKKGAAVMFTKNSPKEGFVNGTLGEVEGFRPTDGMPIVKVRNGQLITVTPMEWSMEENGKVKAQISQLPLRLAWAMTVHKSQGMSLDEAIMDLGDVFEYGQGYVALSRVRRLSGLHILGWNARAFQVHPHVLEEDGTLKRFSNEADAAFETMSSEDLRQMHENFLKAIGGSITKTIKKKSSGKGDTREATLTLLNQGKTIGEIAEERGLTRGTVIGHIEELISQGKADHTICSRFMSPELLESLPAIHRAFDSCGIEKIHPVFEKLKGEYSYDDLRLARLMYKKE
ncbi:MAG TPA: helix-turn-helix domain-containing protein [Candidatus Paceibacterota bacterium]|nr:helix-turn-helix domain-containing protein [Candidatus Paceibacterota bacterium]